MKLFLAILLFHLSFLLSGCGVYIVKRADKKLADVQGVNSAEETLVDVHGVPFLTRVPVSYQETKLLQTRWKVQYVMTVGLQEYRAPSVPFDMLPGETGRAALLKINNELDRQGAQLTPKTFREVVEKLVDENARAWHSCGSNGSYDRVCAVSSDTNSVLLSNVFVTKTEISSRQHYINVRRPLIGKATATVELAPDGTLAKSTGEIESKTVETIVSIIPIADYAKKVLKLGEYAAKTASDGVKISSGGGRGGTSLDGDVSISYEVTPEPWLYVLQSRAGAGAELPPALSYGPSEVELVEASKVADPSKKEGEAPKGWSISGTVTPPAGAGK